MPPPRRRRRPPPPSPPGFARGDAGRTPPPPGSAPGDAGRPLPPPASAGWDRVAAWYDRLVGDEGSDYHRAVLLPTALRLLDPRPGERFLDLCCGQGVLGRALLERQAGSVLGVDASRRLIAAARARGPRDPRLRYLVADATRPGDFGPPFDGVACVMAAQDLADLPGLCRTMAAALRDGGRAVLVLMHPCFRVPRQSAWGWDEARRIRYRRVDRYLTPLRVPIATHPGRDPGQHTVFYHRPLADYLNALGAAGLAVTAAEEPRSHRRIQPGGRSRGENRAAEEFPLFLALRAVRLG